jgi:ammonium transporter, Amt family
MQLNKFSTLGKLGAGVAALMAPAIAFAQEAASAAAAAAPVPEKADTAFMYVATILVLFMIIPGLALFYGGLVRTKNMLSVLMQCTVVAAVMMLVWVIYGYSFAFGGGTGPYFGGFGKLFLSGVSLDSTSATFSEGVVIYEYTFIAFQMTFAAITPALIVGAFAERVKFSAVILFTILWATFVYFPIAHMVWDANGLIFGMGALDFAGGTVVHINAGVAGLLRQGHDGAPLHDADDGRRGHAVVRLVRLQRRLQPRSIGRCGSCNHEHLPRNCRCHRFLVAG